MPNLIKKSWTVSIKGVNDIDDHENPGVIVETNESEISKQDFVFESIKEYMEEIGFEHVELQNAGDELMEEEVVKEVDLKNGPQDSKDDHRNIKDDLQDLKNDSQDLKDDPKVTIDYPQVNFENSDDFETMEEHDNPGDILFLHMCEICGKDFAGPVTLKIHERFHINDNIIPNDHLQIDPQDLQDDPKDLQDDPKDLQDDPQDFQDDPQKVHDDPLDLQDDPQDSYTNDLQNYLQDNPQESFEPEYAVETVVTETDESLPILEELEITMLEAQESETFKQDCIFESFKEYMEGIGCDNVELQKAIDNLKLMNKSFEPECANETDTFEESENIDKPIETEKTKQPGYIDEINEFFEPECADKTDVTDTFETSESVYKPIRTEKTDKPSKPKELENNDNLKRMNNLKKPETSEENIGNTDRAHEFFKPDLTETFEESESVETPETNQSNMQAKYESQVVQSYPEDPQADSQDLKNDPQDLKDDPKDLKNDPQDLKNDPEDLHAGPKDPKAVTDNPQNLVNMDDPKDLQNDPNVCTETEKPYSCPICDKRFRVQSNMKVHEKRCKMHSNRKGKNKFRKIEITKVDKSTESEVSDTFEESENVDKPNTTEKTDEPSVLKEPGNNEELTVCMTAEPDISQLNYYSDTDQLKIPDVSDMFEESENVDQPIETEKTAVPSKPKEPEELIVRMAGEPEIRQLNFYSDTDQFKIPDLTDMFEESENVDQPIEIEKTDESSNPKEPENNEELMISMTAEPEISQLNYYSDTDQFKIPDVTDMFEESENVDQPIETEKTDESSNAKEPENNEELIVRMAGEPEIRQGPL